MSEKLVVASNAQKRVQQSWVSEVDLRGFDQALLQVRVKRLELADHERILEDVEVVAGGGGRHSKTRRDLAGIPELPVRVRQHLPETTKHRRGDAHTESRQVPFQMRLNERLTPSKRCAVGLGEIAQWIATPSPELRVVAFGRADLRQGKRGQLVILDATRETLSRLPREGGSGWS